ncbi:discoidin domain-containing protein [uncultured Prevotella sp.]|uniref:discoidin domain-containing protein n=1 Tax=uncultured Prevotella sp. TaxID=159272 RepID=UPI002676B3A4|nr:discoidin domain-containing protein [uncultured Prevotella sp.]
MKQIHNLYKLLILFCAAFLAQNAVAQVEGDKYHSLGEEKISGVSVIDASSEGGGAPMENAADGNDGTMWKSTTKSSSDRYPWIILDVGENYRDISSISLYVKDAERLASSVSIQYASSSNPRYWTTETTINNFNSANLHNVEINLGGRYVRLYFTRLNTDVQIGLSEVTFYSPTVDLTQISVQHKPAKWYDLRKTMSINAADNFDEDESLSMNIAYDNQTKIQAAHTLIDTIYVHAGTSVTLTLPDYLNGTTNNKTYQRWYNYLTEGTFATGNTGSGDIVDYLTPGTAVGNNAANGTGYRFKNGYIGQPLSSACLYVMDFYVPKTGYQNWYLVACDVSGYTDFTEDFSSDSKNSSFANGGYWEPTLSHRFIYFIRVIEDETSWAAKQLNAGKPIEEKDITMPATRLPDYTDEMVALSMDARSYLTPNGGTNEADGDITVSLDNNTAGITLLTTSLSGENRVIFINYPVKNSDNTQSVNTPTDGSDPKATVNVSRNGTLVARYNITFKEESRLLTQTQVSQENAKENSAYGYRMPDYLKENYELLTELNFDFDDAVAEKYGLPQCYPFPLGWSSSTYGFYDGGVEDGDFTGPTGSHCPEWGYYGILNSYVECRDKDGSNWGWTGYTYNAPDDADPIRYNSKGNQSTYHLYADVSDRPGVIARLPFDRKLCPGTELFVTAWVKCARGDDSANNAAALFSIMGVKDRGVGTSSTKDYTPIYRYQTGQIPATYRNDGGLAGKIPGFEERNGTTGGNNDWLQVYFSFINTNSDDYDSYILQIDNNSASTNGGDIYIDDIRVYVMSPNAKVTQLEATCTNDRTLTNIELDWEQLLSRLGYNETTNDEDAIDFCFVDKTKYNNYLAESGHETDYKGAVEASVIEVGNNEDPEQGGYNGKYHTLYFKMPFEQNKVYDITQRPNLAANNMNDGKAYFYGYTDEANVRSLSVDFYSALTPNRPYILLINTHDPSNQTLDASDFNYNIDDACVIKTEFYVTAQNLIRVNGEVVDPSTDFCAGQVFNFSANLRVPTGVNDDGTAIYTEIKDGVYFDWFFGTEDEYTEVNTTYGVSLLDALTAFRNIYTDNEDLTGVPAEGNGAFTKDMYDIISHYLEKSGEDGGQHAPLVLHKENLDITLLNSGLQLVVQPIRTLVPPGGITEDIWTAVCWSYIPLVLTTSGNAPQLHAGFNSVKYPADDFNPSLRIGLSQIKETTADKPLRVDLRGAKFSSENSNATSLGMVTSVSSEVFKNIYLVGTDDPEYNNETFFPADFSEYSLPVGYLTELYAEPYVEGSQYNDHMNIYFDTTTEQENGFQFQPKEGYTYTFAVHFEEHGLDVNNACFGVFTVDMKVVPENLVWSGAGATSNWNNDANWKRADAKDLKNTDGTYTDNAENTTDKGFVPMLFSNVIMPKDSKAELYMAGYGDGGAWTNSSRPDYMEQPTENIQYDLMAYESNDALTTQRYRVNICRDIHFELGALMLHAEQLLYNKAWTDVEVTPGQWTAVSTPLQGVVAGDWYAPTTGRQETEYFKDIKFNTTDYSRLNPAVYQRSWSTGANIVENLQGTNTPVSFTTEWSSAYNDASVPYVAGGGFSIKGVTSNSSLLFRFPKADKSYDVSTAEEDKSVDRTNAGKLLVTGLLDRSNPLKYNPQNDVTTTLTPSADGKYLMVGNPFMAPLDVQAFVESNSDVLAQKYWIGDMSEDNAVAFTENGWSAQTSLIAPYSVFYVQIAETATPDEKGNFKVKFTADMQKFETTSTGEGSQTVSLKIKAEDAEGSSSAAVRYAASASNGFGMEDAQMISGLTGNADNAPKVYTVAGNTAVSVNQLKDAQRIPLGVTAADGSVVTLTFSGVAAVKDAAIYDAELQSETPLYEGYQLTVNGPSYGRYFLIGHGSGTTGITETGAEGNVSVSSIVPRQVVVTSDTALRSVSVWSAGGALLKKVSPNGNFTCTLNGVDSGMVVVRTETESGSQVTKIRVR